jgi:hypothetical protein
LAESWLLAEEFNMWLLEGKFSKREMQTFHSDTKFNFRDCFTMCLMQMMCEMLNFHIKAAGMERQ